MAAASLRRTMGQRRAIPGDRSETMAEEFTLDRSVGQPTRLVVICEAAGMAPQLARVADPFGMTVMSGGGFDSLTDKHKFAASLADHDRPTQVLHIGDHDPSGVSMFLAFLEDVEAFARDLGGDVTFTRLAVTPSQIERDRAALAILAEFEISNDGKTAVAWVRWRSKSCALPTIGSVSRLNFPATKNLSFGCRARRR